MDLGILTLATPSDYKKAIGLALSARVSNPGLPLAVACSPKLASTLKPHFDFVIEENPALRGFVHKVHLDKYSPFKDTFFFDSDVLLFRDLKPIAQQWANQPYTACGKYLREGHSAFGLDRAQVLKKIGKQELVVIDGAGHAFFRKPDCFAVFDLAREITDKHLEYAGNIKYADEDVMDIAMTMLNLAPAPEADFFSRYVSAAPGTMSMDATQGRCTYVATKTGQVTAPHMMHFAANEAAFQYAWQLHRLFKVASVSSSGLLMDAVNDFYTRSIAWPVKARLKRLFA
ncbi:MAG: hypothetical protein V4627_11515 [Pseudomonadota bacterium]